ncbi:MAG: DUF5711 family protein [Oscillospiraceae bacterium]|nr:DUF5711 family protein [Oscillospiraceae bacterium]
MNKNNHLNKSSENRKQKKWEKAMVALFVMGVIALLAVLIFYNRSVIMSPLEGIGRKSTSEAGFPVRLPGSTGYSINKFDSGFMLLTETYVYVYDSDGGQRYNKRHSYSEPNAAVADTRILVYDINGKQYSFYGRNGLIYEKETDERILYGAIGEDSSAAIVYKHEVYANTLEIYDGKGDWRYKTKFLDDNIIQIAFTAADKDIIITSMSFKDGDVIAAVHKYDTELEDDSGLWKTELPGNAMPFALHIGRNNAFVVCDKSLLTIDLNDGKILDSYDYKGNLIDYAFSDNSVALLVNDFTAGTVTLISLNGNNKSETVVSSGATQVEFVSGSIYVLEPNTIAVYPTTQLSLPHNRLSLGEEYSRFIQVNNDILLLGYNNVEKLDINNTTENTT